MADEPKEPTELDFINTNKETGRTLKVSKSKARAQQRKILAFFQEFPDRKFTPSDIWDYVFERNVPITSVRRAITNLTTSLWLEKCGKEDMKEGIYGKMTHTWRLAEDPEVDPEQPNEEQEQMALW